MKTLTIDLLNVPEARRAAVLEAHARGVIGPLVYDLETIFEEGLLPPGVSVLAIFARAIKAKMEGWDLSAREIDALSAMILLEAGDNRPEPR